MIYLDSSVLLAAVLAEDRQPQRRFWDQELTASWLTVYEVWNRMFARHAAESDRNEVARVLRMIPLIDLAPSTLARALVPFPIVVKTLDGLHLATMDCVRSTGSTVQLATYDRRLAQAAEAMGFALWQWNES